jgi:outer membrane protein assembly factor BamB
VEAAQSYTTPIVVEHDGQEQVVVLGADYVTCHDAATGDELWRVGSLNPGQDQYFRSISSPAVTNDVVIAPYARGNTVTGIRLGGAGDVTDSHVLWTKQGLGADVPVPVASDGKAYVCTDKGKLVCLDVAAGEIVWEWEPPQGRGTYSASPILAGGHMYLTREDGTTLVVRLGDEPELVAENRLGEYTVATPVFVDGAVLIRTEAHLFCIGG